MEYNLNDFGQDLLNRQPLAENLTRIIEDSNDINVIAIDSAWGTGKTTFIKMWENMISTDERYKDKFETLYFNAWENDYVKDPLLALIMEIEKVNKGKNNKAKKVFNKMVEYGKRLVKPALNIPLKLVTEGALGVDDLQLGKTKEVIYKSVNDEKNIRDQFKNEIKKVSDDEECKIVFFIDELDRCRPVFAIELLETIKHLFSVKNIFFVISVDKEQLSYSISTLYGQGMDSEGYLRRFFDLEYKIPIPDKTGYIELNNKNVFKEYKNTNFLEAFLRELIIRDDFSFRDIDKTYNYIKLLMPIIRKFNKENTENCREINLIVYSYILSEMINIKIKHNSIYKKIINLNYDTDEEIDRILSFNKLNMMNFNISGFSDVKLKEIIKPTMNIYLKLNKLTNNGLNYIGVDEGEENKFIVGIKNSDGLFINNKSLNIKYCIENKELEFISKLEFLDNFNNL